MGALCNVKDSASCGKLDGAAAALGTLGFACLCSSSVTRGGDAELCRVDLSGSAEDLIRPRIVIFVPLPSK